MADTLIRQQLEDASRCHSMACLQCSMYETVTVDCQSALAKTALALLDMVKRLEFGNLTWDGPVCYMCNGANTHSDDCELGNLLKRLQA